MKRAKHVEQNWVIVLTELRDATKAYGEARYYDKEDVSNEAGERVIRAIDAADKLLKDYGR